MVCFEAPPRVSTPIMSAGNWMVWVGALHLAEGEVRDEKRQEALRLGRLVDREDVQRVWRLGVEIEQVLEILAQRREAHGDGELAGEDVGRQLRGDHVGDARRRVEGDLEGGEIDHVGGADPDGGVGDRHRRAPRTDRVGEMRRRAAGQRPEGAGARPGRGEDQLAVRLHLDLDRAPEAVLEHLGAVDIALVLLDREPTLERLRRIDQHPAGPDDRTGGVRGGVRHQGLGRGDFARRQGGDAKVAAVVRRRRVIDEPDHLAGAQPEPDRRSARQHDAVRLRRERREVALVEGEIGGAPGPAHHRLEHRVGETERPFAGVGAAGALATVAAAGAHPVRPHLVRGRRRLG